PLTGLIQYCVLQPGALVPWGNPVWGHFFVHKVLRLLTPILFGIGSAALAAWLALRAPVATIAAAGVIAAVALVAWLVGPAALRRGSAPGMWGLRLVL